jgi:hypothetical protein
MPDIPEIDRQSLDVGFVGSLVEYYNTALSVVLSE